MKKANPARDAFTFSLGGMTTIASFVAAPAVANDRLNKVQDDQLEQAGDNPRHPAQKPRDRIRRWLLDLRPPVVRVPPRKATAGIGGSGQRLAADQWFWDE